MVAYSVEAKPQNPAQTSIIGDTDRLCANLVEIHGQLTKIVDTLHGAEPRDANILGNAPSPVPSVRHNIDSAFRMTSSIFAELSRLEARL